MNSLPIPDDILRKVCEGQVLDDNGRWVPLDVMVRKERKLVTRLEEGFILADTGWTTLAEAKQQGGVSHSIE